ncbi:MAG: hypothetical protein KDC75_24120 [Phaeodactylibacter sp.]|nr:hypothetical protein [Phaeodactylibacter sp.]
MKVGYLLLFFITTSLSLSAQLEIGRRLDLDVIGDSRFSIYNFTDQVIPYYGLDSWIEAKLSIWGDRKEKSWGLYASGLGSHMVARDTFRWQKFFQLSLGGQIYPYYWLDKGKGKVRFFKGLRLFAIWGRRHYYQKEKDEEGNPFSAFEEEDIQAGGDFYFDNLFHDNRINLIIWSNATYRHTNFSHEGYRNVLWSGNIKVGLNVRKYLKKDGTQGKVWRKFILPYLTAEWAFAQSCKCRWWENYLRGGLGVRLFPHTFKKYSSEPASFDLLRRFNVYIEGVGQITTLNIEDDVEVKKWDLRAGISFSTSGIFRSGNNKK